MNKNDIFSLHDQRLGSTTEQDQVHTKTQSLSKTLTLQYTEYLPPCGFESLSQSLILRTYFPLFYTMQLCFLAMQFESFSLSCLHEQNPLITVQIK